MKGASVPEETTLRPIKQTHMIGITAIAGVYFRHAPLVNSKVCVRRAVAAGTIHLAQSEKEDAGLPTELLWFLKRRAYVLHFGPDYTFFHMIINQPHRLHKGVYSCRSDKRPAPLFQVSGKCDGSC